jgi:hypothetical protein
MGLYGGFIKNPAVTSKSTVGMSKTGFLGTNCRLAVFEIVWQIV